MSNDWFSGYSRLAKGSKARADAVNALFDDIVTGMDKMPTEVQMNSGTRNFAADTGAANAYACALSHVSAPIEDGQHVVLFVDAADVNTSTGVTLNVSAIGNVAVKFPDGENPAIGDIIGMCEFRYSNTDSVWHFVTTSLARVTAAAASAAAALVSENNAAASEVAALVSENNAAASEAAALVSENNAAASEAALDVFASTTLTFTDVAAASDGTPQNWAHGLGTDDIDFGFTISEDGVLGANSLSAITGALLNADNRFISSNPNSGPSDPNNTTQSPAEGNIRVNVRLAAGTGTNSIKVHIWAKVR